MMIRFLFILTLLILLLVVGKNNPTISFLIYLSIVITFLVIMNINISTNDLNERNKMISTNEGRYYYNIAINSNN
jgi:hypothetical protein